MKKSLFLYSILLFSQFAFSNSISKISSYDFFNTADSIFTIVETMPEFPGGQEALMKYMIDNIKYPEEAKKENIQGRVFVEFVIDKTGQVTKSQIIRGLNKLLDQEALRVVKSMPKWKAGEQSGEKVDVRWILPIVFKL